MQETPTIDPAAIALLVQQHQILTDELTKVISALQLMVFGGILFFGCMILLAAWSVYSVNKRQKVLEGKFNLLVDLMLKAAEREVERRRGQSI